MTYSPLDQYAVECIKIQTTPAKPSRPMIRATADDRAHDPHNRPHVAAGRLSYGRR